MEKVLQFMSLTKALIISSTISTAGWLARGRRRMMLRRWVKLLNWTSTWNISTRISKDSREGREKEEAIFRSSEPDQHSLRLPLITHSRKLKFSSSTSSFVVTKHIRRKERFPSFCFSFLIYLVVRLSGSDNKSFWFQNDCSVALYISSPPIPSHPLLVDGLATLSDPTSYTYDTTHALTWLSHQTGSQPASHQRLTMESLWLMKPPPPPPSLRISRLELKKHPQTNLLLCPALLGLSICLPLLLRKLLSTQSSSAPLW